MKLIISLFTAAIVSCTSLLSCEDPIEKKIAEIKVMPNYRIQKLDGTIIRSTKVTANNWNTIILYFDPNCDHCQNETKILTSNSDQLKSTNIIMLSHASLPAIQEYSRYFKIDGFSNITIGNDIDKSVFKYVDQGSYPMTVIYNRSQKLVKVIKGEIDSTSLHSYLN